MNIRADLWLELTQWICSMIALGLHACLVMCEISLVKFRYASDQQTAIHNVKKIAGIARLIEHGDQVARVVRFGKVICLAITSLVWIPNGTAFLAHHLSVDGNTAGIFFLVLHVFDHVVLLFCGDCA